MKSNALECFGAIYLASAREFMRDRTAVILVLLLPVVLAGFFGLVFGRESDFTIHLGVANEDTGPVGGQVVAGLQAPQLEETVLTRQGTEAELLEALSAGQLSAVFVLPADLSASLSNGQQVTVEVLYDASQPNAAGAGLAFLRTYLSEVNLSLSGAAPLLHMEPRSLNARPLRAVDLQLPNFLGISLLWMGLFGTALPLIQMREQQVLRRLRVTPLTPGALLTAQVAWRLTMGLLQTGLFLLVGCLGFDTRLQGSWVLLLAVVVLGTLVFTGLGYLLAGLASSTEGLAALAQAVNFPMMFLSGSLFSANMLPVYLRPAIAAMPLTYLSDALRQVMAGAPAMYPLWLDMAVLGGWLAVLMALAVRFWRWE
jgi:ABC-2 type transport system permease protein